MRRLCAGSSSNRPLRNALERRELQLVYQPIYSVATASLIGFEALMRWRSPVYGNIEPTEFIPIAEQTTLMCVLGEWALEEGCRQLAWWRAELPEAANLRISVNVSKKQLTRMEFLPSVERILATYPGVGAALNIEVTESAIMSDPERIAEVLIKLRTSALEFTWMTLVPDTHRSVVCIGFQSTC